MNRFGKPIKNERGLSLMELLVTITISSIMFISITSVFVMGMKTYEKINTEAKLRDEADYVTAMVMNELYSANYDDIQYNETTKAIQFCNRKTATVNNDDIVYEFKDTQKEDNYDAKLYIDNGTVKLDKLDESGNTSTISFQSDESIKLKEGSNIGLECTKRVSEYDSSNENEIKKISSCQSGIIQLHFIFEIQNSSIPPMTVTSEIGF